MQEVEREVEDDEGGTGGGAKKGRKRKVQVMEYCYEPEMEGAWGVWVCLSVGWAAGWKAFEAGDPSWY